MAAQFDAEKLQRQVRSYLATRRLIGQHGLDFVGVKCQPELSNGYVCQCVAHMLLNGTLDAEGDEIRNRARVRIRRRWRLVHADPAPAQRRAAGGAA